MIRPEHRERGKTVGLLKQHMCATLGAADGWQEEHSCTLIGSGFTPGGPNQRIFPHSLRTLACVVQGGGFTFSWPAKGLEWIEEKLGEKYEPKVGGRLCLGPNDGNEGMVRNRVVRWCADSVAAHSKWYLAARGQLSTQ